MVSNAARQPGRQQRANDASLLWLCCRSILIEMFLSVISLRTISHTTCLCAFDSFSSLVPAVQRFSDDSHRVKEDVWYEQTCPSAQEIIEGELLHANKKDYDMVVISITHLGCYFIETTWFLFIFVKIPQIQSCTITVETIKIWTKPI